MKRLISLIIFLSFCIMFLHAEQMNIHLEDGSTESFDISEIDNINASSGLDLSQNVQGGR